MKQVISKQESCSTCGSITHFQEVKYFCDVCGKELSNYELEIHCFPENYDLHTDDFNFCSWKCLRVFWKHMKDDLKKYGFIDLPYPKPDTIDEVFGDSD